MRDWDSLATEIASSGNQYTREEAIQQLDVVGIDVRVAQTILGASGDQGLNAFLMGWYMRGRLEEDA